MYKLFSHPVIIFLCMMLPIQAIAADDEIWLKYNGYKQKLVFNEKTLEFKLDPLLSNVNHKYIIDINKNIDFENIRDLYIKSSRDETLMSGDVEGVINGMECDVHEREALYKAIMAGKTDIPKDLDSIELQYKYKQNEYIHALAQENIRLEKIIEQLKKYKLSAHLIHLNKQVEIQSKNIEQAVIAIKSSLLKDIQLEQSLIAYFKKVGGIHEDK